MIRAFDQTDVEKAAEIEPKMSAVEMLRLMAISAFVGFVEAEDDTIKGFILGWSTDRLAEVVQTTVAADFRRQGIGLRLLKRFQHDYGSSGCWLDVRADNDPALRLYAQAGFVEDSRRKDYYHDDTADGMVRRVDAILMHAPPIVE
jgi:ribosomal-protein-alanine N-acetyltransferase